jgi:hypothetical protein
MSCELRLVICSLATATGAVCLSAEYPGGLGGFAI